jgi:serine/threonine protein kinase
MAKQPTNSERPASLTAANLPFLDRSEKAGSLGRLARYEVLQVLGQGAFGIVLKAFDNKLQRLVAIKVLIPLLADDVAARKRFLREARAGAAVNNRHIVDIYAVEDHPVPYLVMEYIAGGTLEQRLNEPWSAVEVLRIGQQIADGLAAAHAAGLIHRDIKPGNILLEGEPGALSSAIGERAKIADFGLARVTDDASVTQAGMLTGTPLYMSPEQAQDDPIDHRTDLFSLGSVLYVLCTGRPPFTAPSSLAVLQRVCADQPLPIREFNPHIPDWLCRTIARLQAKSPADRFSSAREVADLFALALTELQQHGEVSSRLEQLVDRPARAPSPRSRRFRLAVLLGVVMFLGLLVSGWGWFFRGVPGDFRGGEGRDPQAESGESRSPVEKEDPTPDDFAGELKRIAGLPAEEQVKAVAALLRERNPEFDGTVGHKIDNGVVTEFSIDSSHVTDLSPVRALTELRRLDCDARGRKGPLVDLSPLKGMKIGYLFCYRISLRDLSPLKDLPLRALHCGGTQVTELSALKGLPLQQLYIDDTVVADLSPLSDLPLEVLDCAKTRVGDLSPLRKTPLRWLKCQSTQVADLSPLTGKKLGVLWCQGTRVTDLSVLAGMPLVELRCDFKPDRDAGVLRSLPTLRIINGKPAQDFWKEAEPR